MGKAAQVQAGRDRARDARLKAARERRRNLDPEQLVRERRIDEASVEVAWEERAKAEQAVVDAEVAAATATERLLSERLAFKDVVHLTGLDPATLRRLRQLGTDSDERDGASSGGVMASPPTVVTRRRRQHELRKSWKAWPLTSVLTDPADVERVVLRRFRSGARSGCRGPGSHALLPSSQRLGPPFTWPDPDDFDEPCAREL